MLQCLMALCVVGGISKEMVRHECVLLAAPFVTLRGGSLKFPHIVQFLSRRVFFFFCQYSMCLRALEQSTTMTSRQLLRKCY